MLTLFSPASISHQDSEEKPVCSAVIIYEDIETGKHANHFCENLMHDLDGTALWTKNLWSFKVLDIPHVRCAAAEMAAMADVVILALHGRAALPDDIQAWMEKWAGRVVGRNPILIALFNTSDDGQETVASTRVLLGTMAETAGLTFLHTLGPALVEDRTAA
jgi:hypothetical protein